MLGRRMQYAYIHLSIAGEWHAQTSAHHAQLLWECQSCTETFDDRNEFEIHMRQAHAIALMPEQFEFVIRTCARRTFPFKACIFCGKHEYSDEDPSESRNARTKREAQLVHCMARHMRSLALISLPDDLSVSVSNDSASSRPALSGGLRETPDSRDPVIIAFRHSLPVFDKTKHMAFVLNWVEDIRIKSQGNASRPADHDLLVNEPLLGHLQDTQSDTAQGLDDYVGDGPPL